MIATWRGVIMLAIVALALAMIAALGAHSDTEPIDRAVLRVDTSAAILTWTRPHRPDVVIETTPNGWTMRTPKGRCDARAVEAVLATLRGARWHRRGDRARAGAIHTTLAFPGHVIELGESIHGADQTWIVVDGTALLVDGWVARSLDPDPLALRDRRPLAGVAGAHTVTIARTDHLPIELHDRPWHDARGVLAPEVIEPLLRALGQLEIVRLADGAIASAGTRITIDGAAPIAVGGQCPGDLIGLASASGNGCVDPAEWHDVETALAHLDGTPQDIVDHRPAAGPISKILLGDDTIDLDKRPTVITDGAPHPADPDRIAELVAALVAPAALVPVPTAPTRRKITVVDRDGGSVVLVVYPGGILARRGEAIAMQPAHADVFERPIQHYFDPTRWLEDPNTIDSLEIDGTVVKRGAVIGEWTRESGVLPPADATVVDALAGAVAQVRAPFVDVPAAWRPTHTITVTFVPPIGSPSTHRVELGPPVPTGCLARFDRIPGTSPLALCTAATAATAILARR